MLPPSGMPRAIAPVLLFALVGACRSHPAAAPLGERVILKENRPKGPEAPPKQTPDWFRRQIEEARRDEAAGHLHAAFQRIAHALEQSPATAERNALVEVWSDLQQRVLELPTLKGRVLAGQDPALAGEPVLLRVELQNVSGRSIKIPAKASRTSGSVLFFEVTRKDYDVRAEIVESTFRIERPLPHDVQIAPGKSAEIEVRIPAADNPPVLAGIRIFRVSGTLRPALLDLAGLRRYEGIPLGAGQVRCFRPNYEPLQDNPVRRIAEAVSKKAGVHLLTAAALVAPASRRAAVDELVSDLQGGRPIDLAIFSALRYLTGVELGRDAAAWHSWWPRVRGTYFEAPKKPNPKVPTFSPD